MRQIPTVTNDYYGTTTVWFSGVVTEVGDRTRARVRVFGVHSLNMPEGDCPWAVVAYPTTGGQAGSGNISHNLEVGSWVIGLFADGHDYQQPIITGVISGGRSSGSVHYDPVSVPPTGTLPDFSGAGDLFIEGNSNAEKTYNFLASKLIAQGISEDRVHMLTSAFVGVLMLESGQSLDPNALNRSSGAYGIAQWLSRDRIVNGRYLPADAGGGPFPRTLSGQLDYLWFELQTRENNAYRQWINSTNLPDAVAGAAMFERAEEWHRNSSGRYFMNRSHPNFKKRLQYARQIYQNYSYTPQPRSTTAISQSLEG